MLVFHDMTIGQFLVWFFVYSFLGWCMECVVIRKELGYWENRGFAKLPFCVIYGFGTLVAMLLFGPFVDHWFVLYLVCMVSATIFEYLVAMLMLKLFGNVWWNYDHKKFNYKGILCLESTIGWGLLGMIIFYGINQPIESAVKYGPQSVVTVIGVVLLVSYLLDFTWHFTKSIKAKHEGDKIEFDASEYEEDEYKEINQH